MTNCKTFRIRGRSITICYDEIIAAADLDYSDYAGTKYFVIINNKIIPALNLLENVLKPKGYSKYDVTTKYAFIIFNKFGIKVIPKDELLKELAGCISIGGDAVQEEYDYYKQ